MCSSDLERERVAIAAALAVDPAILLLDEPTRGMDAAHRAALARIVAERRTRGLAAVIATHDRAFARAAADAVWTVDDARVGTRVLEPQA